MDLRYEVNVEDVEPTNRGKGPDCSRCGGPVGMLPWLPPYRAVLEVYGETLGDFVKVIGEELFISERFATAFRNAGLTGLQGFFPVEIVRVRRMERGPEISMTPQYLAVTVRDSRMALDLQRSRIHYTEPPTCGECREGAKRCCPWFCVWKRASGRGRTFSVLEVWAFWLFPSGSSIS